MSDVLRLTVTRSLWSRVVSQLLLLEDLLNLQYSEMGFVILLKMFYSCFLKLKCGKDDIMLRVGFVTEDFVKRRHKHLKLQELGHLSIF